MENCSTIDEKGNILNREQLLVRIRKRLNPRKEEKEMNGEVFTPMWLCEKIVDCLPKTLFHPNTKILGQSVGIGNFQISLYYKLMDSLGHLEEYRDEEKRRKHILENMLYMVELNPDNVILLEEIINPDKKYKLNVICDDYLKLDVLERFGVKDGFDLIIDNPPYNTRSIGTGVYIWHKFIVKGLSELKYDGYLNLITPPAWRKPESEKSRNKGLYELMTKKNQMIYLEMYDLDDGKRVFDAGTRFDIYLIQKTTGRKSTKVIDTKRAEYEINLFEHEFIPNHSINQVFQLTAVGNERKSDVIFSAMYHGANKKYVSSTKSEEFKYPVIKAIHKNSPPVFYYSSTNERGLFGVPKIIFSESGITEPVIDIDGKYGQTQSMIAIKISSLEEGEEISKFLKSREFQNIIDACSWSLFRIEWRMFSKFKHDFYKISLPLSLNIGRTTRLADNENRYQTK